MPSAKGVRCINPLDGNPVQVIPEPLRHWLALLTPVILVLVLTLYWLIRLGWQGIQVNKKGV